MKDERRRFQLNFLDLDFRDFGEPKPRTQKAFTQNVLLQVELVLLQCFITVNGEPFVYVV